MKSEWKQAFFREMEKRAFMGLVMGGINAATTMSDIKANKSKVRLAAPTAASVTGQKDPYAYQFTRSSTPNRSLFG